MRIFRLGFVRIVITNFVLRAPLISQESRVVEYKAMVMLRTNALRYGKTATVFKFFFFLDFPSLFLPEHVRADLD